MEPTLKFILASLTGSDFYPRCHSSVSSLVSLKLKEQITTLVRINKNSTRE